ncbi:Uncharacterised protein [Mycobacterium tuberculosis]|nr:Uncharacterised protein [Mycobacterium tuberculosis]
MVPLSQVRCATARTRRPCSARWRTTDSACSWSTPGSASRQRGRIVSGAPLSINIGIPSVPTLPIAAA